MEGGMRYRLQSHIYIYNVPKSSLKTRVKKFTGDKSKYQEFQKCPATQKCVFTDELEGMLVEHIKTMESWLFRLSKTDLQRLVFQLADRIILNHNFNKETRLVGIYGVGEFLKRHCHYNHLKLQEQWALIAL